MLMRFLICFSNILISAQSYKILVYSPTLGNSHVPFLGKIADVLVQAGHDVVVFQPVFNEMGNGTKLARVIRRPRDFQVRLTFNDIQTDVWSSKEQDFWQKYKFADFIGSVRNAMCRNQLLDKPLMQQLRDEKFDIAIGEYSCFYAVLEAIGLEKYITAFNTPLLGASILGLPSSSSFVPSYVANQLPTSYVGRARNLFSMILSDIRLYGPFLSQVNDAIQEVLRPDFYIIEKIGKSAFFLVNVDEFTEFPRPISHKVIYIGGMGMNQPKPLDSKFHEIAERSERGMFLVSFGSAAESSKMPPPLKQKFLDAFAAFPDVTFLWKYEVEDNVTQGHPNVVTGKWLPQNDLLAHPKMLGFITHGGQNSISEATFHGVPLIALPLFADQPRNGILIEYRKIGKCIDKQLIMEGKLVDYVREILDNPSYKENAVRIGRMIKAKPMKPEERIVKYVEFAAEFGNDNNLDLSGRDLNFVQYYNLDVIIPFLASFVLILCIIFVSIGKILSYILLKIKLYKKLKEE